MESHISPGLAVEIRFALDLIQEHGTDARTLGVIREIVARRLAEVEAELAGLPDWRLNTVAALRHALQMVAAELESISNPPQRDASPRQRTIAGRRSCRTLRG